jgi:O-antigen ligase
MGFVLSVLYFVTYYLTPTTMFGPLAAYRIELILAALILLVSLPRLMGSFILKTPQSLALLGLALATTLSVLIAAHWAGGAVNAFLGFIPNAFAYFLVCLHCNSKKKLQVLVLMLSFVCLFVIAHGYIDLVRGVPENATAQSGDTQSADPNLWNIEHPYLFAMGSGTGGGFYRLRGLGLINDPNDFGQLVVCVIPLVFIFWRAKKMLQNIAFVLLPVCALVYGVFLTRSRGALLALIAMAVMAGRRRIGTVPALLVAGGLFAAAMALHFTGGREISAESGSDRTILWGEGLQLLKSHPLFGVGFGYMPDYTEEHLTAHNSLVVCAAELGLFGLYFWSLFLVSTVRDALAIASPAKVSEGEPIVAEEELFPQATRKIEAVDKAEVNRLGRLVVLSLTGFLVAGWFLSRAYVMTLFLLGGMVEVIYEMALQRGMIAPRLRLARVLPYAGGLAISLILLMYIMLRITNLMH